MAAVADIPVGVLGLSPVIKGIVVLDGDGGRIAAKYYGKDFVGEAKKQSKFEAELHRKTFRSNARSDAEVILFNNHIVVYKFVSDANFYVISGADENELVVLSVLNAVEEATSMLLRGQVDKRTLVDNLDLLLLTIDECVDDGMILETDPASITQRVAMRGADGQEVPLQDQTLGQALQTARDQLARSFA